MTFSSVLLSTSVSVFSFIVRYIPDATGAIYDVLQEMARSHAAKRKRYEGEDAELLKKVSVRSITKETLSEKLAQHVEKVLSYFGKRFFYAFHHLYLKDRKSVV